MMDNPDEFRAPRKSRRDEIHRDKSLFVQHVLQRARSGHRAFELPEMTIADYVTYFDCERLPETLEGIRWNIDHYPDTPIWTRGISLSTLEAKEQERERLKEILALLEEWYLNDLITADDYQRLITPQHYSHAHLLELKKRVNYFIPNELGVGCKGHHVFILRTGDGEYDFIYLRLEGETWIHDDDPFQGKS